MINTPEVYVSSVPDWATQVEMVVHEPNQLPLRPQQFDVRPEFVVEFIVATVATPNGLFPPYLDAKLELIDPNGASHHVRPSQPGTFVSDKPGLVIVGNPVRGLWHVSATSGLVPYAVTVMAFHPQVPPNSPPSPGLSGASPFKCRACKITAKGLALAIVAAATLPALPAALLAAVSAYLGVTSVIAAAFIASVLGDTADIIAEKLCKRVSLC